MSVQAFMVQQMIYAGIAQKVINMRNSNEKEAQPIENEIQLFESFSKDNQRFIITLLARMEKINLFTATKSTKS